KYRVAIFDEAHNLEDVAADHLGLSITRGQADYLLRRLFHERGTTAHGLLSVHGDNAAMEQVYRTRAAVDDFFGSVLTWRLREQSKASRVPTVSDSIRVRTRDIVADRLSGEFLNLASCLDRIGDKINNPEE